MIYMAPIVGYTQNQPIASPARSSFFPMLKDGSPAAVVAFTQPKQNVGMAMMNPEGSEYTTELYLGKRGAAPAENSKEKYFYFQVAKDQLIVATGTFYVTVTYLDKGQGAMGIEYMSQEEGKSKTPRQDRFFLGNSGIWQQHSFTLTHAIFDRSMDRETDFRIFCPGIFIHAVMVTRVPAIQQGRATSSLFRQEGATPPAGYEIGVILAGTDGGGLWEKEDLFTDKCRLYRAWGASYIIDTVNVGMLQKPNGSYDFSVYANRVKRLAARNLVWTPRVKIGDPRSLPLNIATNLQKAVGINRPKEGPMISLWEPRLPDVYSQIFGEFSKAVNTQQMPRFVLSFAGDWGPLLLSSDMSEESGWPDLWAGDPIAQQSFRDFLIRRYGKIELLRSAWRDNIASWNAIIPSISPDNHPIRNLDVLSWYRDSMTGLVRQIASVARRYFPQTRIVLEIADDFGYSATDPMELASVAAELNASVVTIGRDAMPSSSPIWLCFSHACQRRGVKFGLRTAGQSGAQGMLSILYSLASEGGSMLYFTEGFMTGEKAWSQYAENVGRLRLSSPAPRVAVIFPRTSFTGESSFAFDRVAGQLRDYFGYDVVDESNLPLISATDYPLIFVLWGDLWTPEALSSFERLARSGAALVVYAEEPWQTPQGDVSCNERLFAVQLVRTADGWRFEPRRSNTQLFGNTNPIARQERRVVKMGVPGDDVFLEGLWGQSENENAARQYGFPFDSFRWMGERGSINLPMIPGKEYELELEGFIPPGKRVQLYINREHLGSIEGNGPFRWKQPISGKLCSKSGNVNVLLRGQLWNMGEVLGATQTQRVSLALSRVSVVPRGEKPENLPEQVGMPASPDFQRKSLRGSWMRELGQGITLLAPGEYVTEWVFREMLNTFVMNPALLDARYRFTLPPDGALNNVFVKPLSGGTVYLNTNDQSVTVGGWSRSTPTRTIPPQRIFYSN